MLNLNPWPWVALFLVLAGLYGAHRGIVYSEVKKAETAITAVYDKKVADAATAARKTEDELRENKLYSDKDKDAKIKTISDQLALANKRLLDRTQRPANYTAPTTVVQSCSGRELYREDGLFLRGEATRAEALIVERDYYYNQYEYARKLLDERAR